MNNEETLSTQTSTSRRWLFRLIKSLAAIACFFLWVWSIGFAYCLDDKVASIAAKLLAAAIAIAVPISLLVVQR